jgi:hypothetical protein
LSFYNVCTSSSLNVFAYSLALKAKSSEAVLLKFKLRERSVDLLSKRVKPATKAPTVAFTANPPSCLNAEREAFNLSPLSTISLLKASAAFENSLNALPIIGISATTSAIPLKGFALSIFLAVSKISLIAAWVS